MHNCWPHFRGFRRIFTATANCCGLQAKNKRLRVGRLVVAMRAALSNENTQHAHVLQQSTDSVLQALLLKKLRTSDSLKVTGKHVALV
jgi:hypothetical protein